jgi:Spy/CpxP family protein refolding chaperone
MRKRIIIGAGVVALFLAGSAFAIVRHEQSLRNRPLADRIVAHLTRRLNLTDAQQSQVKAILEAERQTVAPLLADAARNRQQLNEATAQGKFEEAQVREIATRQAQTMTELMVAREKVKARIYNEVLTPEQRTKADQLLQERRNRFGKRFHDRATAVVPVVP